MEFKEVLSRRRSIRKYDARPVPADVAERLLDAALAAPSSRNSRSTRLLPVDDPALVARMAGMPLSVVARAGEVLRNLELDNANNEIGPGRSIRERGRKLTAQAVREPADSPTQGMQLSMFQLDDPVLVQIRDQIRGLDINALTPIEALNKLNEIKKITGL